MVTLNGNKIEILGSFPKVGEQVHNFTLTDKNLIDVSLKDFGDAYKILNIFPSIDTSICALSVRNFNKQASEIANVHVLCISADLPFASSRFCAAENLEKVTTLSTFRNQGFLEQFGVKINDGPLKGLCARAVIVLNGSNEVIYSNLVAEIKTEPDYKGVLDSLSS